MTLSMPSGKSQAEIAVNSNGPLRMPWSEALFHGSVNALQITVGMIAELLLFFDLAAVDVAKMAVPLLFIIGGPWIFLFPLQVVRMRMSSAEYRASWRWRRDRAFSLLWISALVAISSGIRMALPGPNAQANVLGVMAVSVALAIYALLRLRSLRIAQALSSKVSDA